VNGLCQAAGVSRAGYYRFLRRPQRKEADMDLRSDIQRIALQWPAYGYRRVQVKLRKQGWQVNHKRVLRLMRADNLLCLRRRKFILTTDSKHGLRIYPNLAKDMVLRRASISFGSPTSPTSACKWSSCTWRFCWMPFHDAASAGPCSAAWKQP
jgi:transposase InsO family protein